MVSCFYFGNNNIIILTKEVIMKIDFPTELITQDRIDRINHQYKRLAGKLNYMNKLTNIGRKFSRNAPCPCLSGKKYKSCCITHLVANSEKVGQLQIAMDKLQDKMTRIGLRIVRRGANE
jgi:uncharacterized protein YecA (UPF0149 family)